MMTSARRQVSFNYCPNLFASIQLTMMGSGSCVSCTDSTAQRNQQATKGYNPTCIKCPMDVMYRPSTFSFDSITTSCNIFIQSSRGSWTGSVTSLSAFAFNKVKAASASV